MYKKYYFYKVFSEGFLTDMIIFEINISDSSMEAEEMDIFEDKFQFCKNTCDSMSEIIEDMEKEGYKLASGRDCYMG